MMNFEIELQRIHEFLKRNKILLIYSIIIAIVCYGYELFNFTLSIDEELNSFLNVWDDKGKILNGRWGTTLIYLLLSSRSVIPYFPTLIAILGIAVSAFLVVANEKVDPTSKLIFCTIFISYPLHSYYLAFNVLNMSLSLGVLFSVVSYLLIKETFNQTKNKTILFIVSLLLLTFSIGVYQGVIPVFIVLVLFYFLFKLFTNEIINKKEVFRQFVVFSTVFILAFVLYKIVNRIFIQSLDEAVRNSTSYTDTLWGWNKFSPGQIINNLINSTKSYFLGQRFYGGHTFKLVFIIVPFLLYVIIWKVKGQSKKILTFLLFFVLLFTPFIIMYAVGSDLPPRSMVALPLLLGILWFLVSINVGKIVRKVLLVFSLLIVLNSTYHTTRLFYSNYVSWQADRDMANRIVERIYQLDLPITNQKIPVAFIGYYNHEENKLFLKSNDVFGASFFGWDNGNPYRMLYFFKTLGINELTLVPNKKIDEISDKIKIMPNWPLKGSVALIKDVVVVKF
jgi:hypothetical protein